MKTKALKNCALRYNMKTNSADKLNKVSNYNMSSLNWKFSEYCCPLLGVCDKNFIVIVIIIIENEGKMIQKFW